MPTTQGRRNRGGTGDETLTITPEEQQKHGVAHLMALTQGSPQQQQRLAALRAKSAELKEARGNARGVEKERIRAQIKAVNDEENRLVDEIASGAGRAQDPMQSLPAKELSVRFLVNQELNIRDQARPYAVPGVATAFEQVDGCIDAGSYCITVLLGPFEKGKHAGGGTYHSPRKVALGVPTKLRGLALVVSGPKDKPETVRQLLTATDLKKLSALVP